FTVSIRASDPTVSPRFKCSRPPASIHHRNGSSSLIKRSIVSEPCPVLSQPELRLRFRSPRQKCRCAPHSRLTAVHQRRETTRRSSQLLWEATISVQWAYRSSRGDSSTRRTPPLHYRLCWFPGAPC